LVTKEENIRLIFGLKIRQLRQEKQLSLQDVAQQAGISVSYLNEIEKGKKYPKANKIAALAQVLEVSYDWLVSLQLNQKLMPIAELLQSDLLTSLPLEIFGIEPSDLIDIISNTPTKISAFISTLIEIARNYDMSVERFYFSVLRSYQEMHENYFEDIERAVDDFRYRLGLMPDSLLQLKDLKDLLSNQYGYVIDEQSLADYEDLQSLRSVTIPGARPKLLINPRLYDNQKAFVLAREIGYQHLEIKDRAYTSSWIRIKSFEQLLNNFYASYFAGAMLIPKTKLVRDMSYFFEQPEWSPRILLTMLDRYQVSPEMLTQRLTNVLPRFFGLSQLFFLRFHHQRGTERFDLNKELHLAGLYNPHGTMLHEHSCRKWVSLNILKDLDQQQRHNNKNTDIVLADVQRSQYFDSENEFVCISLATSAHPSPDTNTSVTLGFLLNEDMKEKILFWNADSVPIRQVGVACERCTATNCELRVAPPLGVQEKLKAKKMLKALAELHQKHR
jgi:transcriptional regulator with XRE-family HTH domain